MSVSKHSRKGIVRRHVLRTAGMCVNGVHTGIPKFKKPGQKKH